MILRRRRLHVDPDALPARLHPVLRRVYAARAISEPRELEHGLERLLPTDRLDGMARAVALLRQALAEHWRILIVGDFDADGATATAVGMRALRAMGAHHVDYLVPNRFEYGYGLTPEIVEVAVERRPDLIITVDNGISSLDGVAEARRRGMRVLVTDHHLPGAELPPADAIVNPNLGDDAFPSKHLAGVGVMFYVLLALRAALREAGHFDHGERSEPNMAAYLDLVALGTVADVVTLDHNNRILIEQGLRRLRSGYGHPGVHALLRVAGRDPSRAVASDLGYAAAPRLNAAGRLSDISHGIECLLADDTGRAEDLARELDTLNRERRELEARMQTEALAALEALSPRLTGEDLPTGLCLFDSGWHQGLVGLLASRVKERTHRPVIAFAPGGEDELKGSARSVPGLHIRDALDAIAARHPGLIRRFGGHAMAAGLSLAPDHLEAFREAFADEVGRHLGAEDLHGVVHTDGELRGDELGLELAEALRAGGPWGQGFPEPVFEGTFEVIDQRIVGERHLKLMLRPPDARQDIEAIAFNHGEPLTGAARVRAAYRLDVNEYGGRRRAQLIVEHLVPEGDDDGAVSTDAGAFSEARTSGV